MQAKVTRVPDGIDRDLFRKMTDSPQFKLFLARVAAEMKRSAEDCERLNDPMELHRAQGKVQAYRFIESLPEIILKGMTRT